jgi:hypothetical protein
VKRILVLGGYGGFGARLSRRLAGRGHHALLAEHHPDLLIDAAGPFQNSDYRVPLACARAGVPYLDLADARGFVTGIGTIEADVAIISGASSVPALSGAVARHLAAGIDRVTQVEVAISASNRATAGPSVAAAILSYVGRPVRLWRNRRWTRGWGWQELRRETFAVAGVPDVSGRWIALAEVPDLDLMPDMLSGRPAVTFRAGTEISVQTIGLWLLSWPIRWFGLSATPLAPVLLPLQCLTRAMTSDRSAMSVRLAGEAGGGFVERRWTLIADQGDGPETPTLAAVLLAEDLFAGRLSPGARDAGRLLELAQFEPLFATLAMRHETVETRLPDPLYRRVMGPAFDALPEAVRAVHRVCRDGGASGEARVTRGAGPMAGLVARIMGLPPAGLHALHVGFAERDGMERWTRSFGRHSFASRLSGKGGRLVERFGQLRFHFDLRSDASGLSMAMRRWSFLGIPLPMALAPRSEAREWQEGKRFRFDVPISLPLIGLVVHYDGWLVPED